MTEQEIFAKCLGLGMTPAGAAGCTANILHESGGNCNNLENTVNNNLGISDDEYVRRVDAGIIDFLARGQGGFGLCQWTEQSRRERFYNYMKSHGASIADERLQWVYMGKEMREYFPHVWSILTHTDDPYTAGYTMCKEFEIPANTEATSRFRGNEAKDIYQRCSGTAPATQAPEQPERETMWPPRMLCKGMNGADFTVLQAHLVAHGYGMTAVNGVFGDSTEKALRNYQQDHGLAVDGIAGNDSFHSLTYFDKVRR